MSNNDLTCFACLTVIDHDDRLHFSEYYFEEVCHACYYDGQNKEREEDERDRHRRHDR